MGSGDREVGVDLESGLKVGLENSTKEDLSGVKTQVKQLFSKVFGAFGDGKIKGGEKVNLSGNVPSSDGVSDSEEQVKSGGQKNVDHVEKKVVKEKRKKSSNKKSPKPPRPPRGPSLDAADQKLIKEISELAMLKRARIERMKALKKMKAAKSQSSGSNGFAMVFTILFCVVILFQGMSSRADSAKFPGSPVSAETNDGGLISVQYIGNAATSESSVASSGSPSTIDPVTGSDPSDDLRRAVGRKLRRL